MRAGSDPWKPWRSAIRRALESAQKFSLVANSVKSELVIEPEIVIS